MSCIETYTDLKKIFNDEQATHQKFAKQEREAELKRELADNRWQAEQDRLDWLKKEARRKESEERDRIKREKDFLKHKLQEANQEKSKLASEKSEADAKRRAHNDQVQDNIRRLTNQKTELWAQHKQNYADNWAQHKKNYADNWEQHKFNFKASHERNAIGVITLGLSEIGTAEGRKAFHEKKAELDRNYNERKAELDRNYNERKAELSSQIQSEQNRLKPGSDPAEARRIKAIKEEADRFEAGMAKREREEAESKEKADRARAAFEKLDKYLTLPAAQEAAAASAAGEAVSSSRMSSRAKKA